MSLIWVCFLLSLHESFFEPFQYVLMPCLFLIGDLRITVVPMSSLLLIFFTIQLLV